MLGFLRARALPGVEVVTDREYQRVVRVRDKVGTLRVSADLRRAALRAELSYSLVGELMPVVTRLRALFDLDARPDAIADRLGRDRMLAPLVRRRPGLRVPGAFDPFEMMVRAVLGQQISVAAATTLAGRLVNRFGTALPTPADPGLSHLFPSADALASASVEELAAIGLPRRRAVTLQSLAAIFQTPPLAGPIETSDVDDFARRLRAIPGIGEWTTEYVAMRALHHPDAFPASDLGIRKALGGISAKAAIARGEAWRPWRSYAVMHLWSSP
jgi:AraC family transcriptional regulator of adaptative response / DNA-3-methyladenine glycosylase II